MSQFNPQVPSSNMPEDNRESSQAPELREVSLGERSEAMRLIDVSGTTEPRDPEPREILDMARKGEKQPNSGGDESPKMLPVKRVETPALDSFGTDLVARARRGEVDPVVGRDAEIERAIEVLCRRSKSNPMILGEPGVGKTAIVEGIAQRIASGTVPRELQNLRIVSLDLNAIVAGTMYRGQFEERFKAVISEARRDPSVVLFIDEIHMLVGAGSASGSMDAANILKPALAREGLRCIGATTDKEYRKYFEKDSALARRFQPITLDAPTDLETVDILYGLRAKYEEHHKVRYTDEALCLAALLSERYLPSRNQPDKSIDVIDEAGARARIAASKRPAILDTQEQELDDLMLSQSEAVLDGDVKRAKRLGRAVEIKRAEFGEAVEAWTKVDRASVVPVTKEHVLAVLSEMSGVPLSSLQADEREKLLQIKERLSERVRGQPEAIEMLGNAVLRARAGLHDPNRPIGSFLFLGPTGVGKTLLCKALAEYLFDDEDALITLDMSEYMEKLSVSRLVGAPPGYVGYEDGGQLTEPVRRRPYCVVLLDEVEKAHPEFFNMLLQVLEEGRLTDSTGRSVSFRNVIIVMTSNLGAHEAQRGRFGFTARTDDASGDYAALRQSSVAAAEDFFRPEFLNRLDGIAVFKPLGRSEIREVMQIELDQFAARVAEKGYALEVDEDVKELLMEKGYDPQYNARPMKRALGQYLENPLVEAILKGEVQRGQPVIAMRNGDSVVFAQLNPTDGLGHSVRTEQTMGTMD